jgi:hypothetical protein
MSDQEKKKITRHTELYSEYESIIAMLVSMRNHPKDWRIG